MRDFAFLDASIRTYLGSVGHAITLLHKAILMMSVAIASKSGPVSFRRVKPSVESSVAGKSSVTFLAHVVFGLVVVLLWTVTLSAHFVDRVILPRYHYSHENSRTVPQRLCDERQITTNDLEDIYMDDYHSVYDVKRMIFKHGAAIVPKILSPKTTLKLRNTIQDSHYQEQDREDFFVLNQDTRRRRLINVNEDTIYADVLEEIATHDTMRPIIEEIAGPDAAVVGLFTITNLPGSEAQPWHADNQFHLSRRQYPDDYHRVFSIVIALQNTTKDMGSTGVCLGTQHCKAVSPGAADDYCIESAPLEAGSTLIFDADIFHHGGEHVDMNAPDRVFFFLVVAPSETKTSSRWLPTRYFQLRWDMFGHTIHDFTLIRQHPWKKWEALGFTFGKGYSFVSYVLRLLANGMKWRFRFRNENYTLVWEDIEDFWQQTLPIASMASCMWVLWWTALRLSCHWKRGRSKVTSKTL